MNDLNKIKHIAEKIALSPEEKGGMRTNILRFVMTPRHNTGLFRFFFTPASAFAAILLILTISGGISLAADGALPGDLLYPIKISVNEEARGAMVLSASEKVKWETERLSRRLEEAEKLAHKKKFSAKTRVKVEENFRAQAERVEKHISDLEAGGENKKAADLSADLEASLDTHEKILEKIDEEEIGKFITKVREKKDNAKFMRIKSETKERGKEEKREKEKKEETEN